MVQDMKFKERELLLSSIRGLLGFLLVSYEATIIWIEYHENHVISFINASFSYHAIQRLVALAKDEAREGESVSL